MRHALDRLVIGQRAVKSGRRFGEVTDQLLLALRIQSPLGPRQIRRECRQNSQLASKGLGRRDTDFRPGMGRQQQISLPRHGAGGHIDDRRDLLPLATGMAERGQRISGFARLTDDDHQPAILHHGRAVAELACHIDIDGDASELLHPIFGDHPRIIAGAARNDGDAADRPQVEIRNGERHPVFHPLKV